jgi:hypothetical protein
MPISDVYNARSGSIAVAQTTVLPLMSVICPATKRDWAVAIHMNIGTTLAAAGSNMLFQLCRPGNSPTGTGGASFGGQNDTSSPASIGQLYTAWSTAPTVGEILYEKELPMASGAAWDWAPPASYEWQIPAIANGSANAGLHIFVTASVVTSTPVLVSLDVSE